MRNTIDGDEFGSRLHVGQGDGERGGHMRHARMANSFGASRTMAATASTTVPVRSGAASAPVRRRTRPAGR